MGVVLVSVALMLRVRVMAIMTSPHTGRHHSSIHWDAVLISPTDVIRGYL